MSVPTPAHKYLATHHVPQLMDELLQRLLDERPSNPRLFLQEYLGCPTPPVAVPAFVSPVVLPDLGRSHEIGPRMMRGTGVVCTVGPATCSKQTLGFMLDCGMDVLRLNFSHGTHEWFADVVRDFRAAVAERAGCLCALALDTKGPEIRTGNMEGGQVTIQEGSEVSITTNDEARDKGTAQRLYVDYKDLPRVVQPGGRIYMDDGLFCLEVLECSADTVRCRAQTTATLADRRGVNLPGARVTLPPISDKDRQDIEFGISQGVDVIFASFIRTAAHVEELRRLLQSHNAGHIQIFSKIESQEGVDNFAAILQASDGVMVARGDLGVEIPAERVFNVQKAIIRKCNEAGKPVICATQMLESMTVNPKPTRAEVTDIGTAIVDGADCVMLSGETAKGKYPLDAVRMMVKVCQEAEKGLDNEAVSRLLQAATPRPLRPVEAMAAAAVHLSFSEEFALLIVLAETGLLQRYVAKYRPRIPVFVVTDKPFIARQASLIRGLKPLLVDSMGREPRDLLARACQMAKQLGVACPGHQAIAVYDGNPADGREDATILTVLRVP
eukprot:EG_transcript_7941